MMNTMPDVNTRLEALERRVRRLQLCLVVLLAAGLTTPWMARPLAQVAANPLRVQGLIIEDANGRPRVVLGAPLPNDQRNTNLRTGLRSTTRTA